MSDIDLDKKAKRDRSPGYPFIPLKTAIQRLTAFEEYFKRHPAPVGKAGLAWGMAPNGSQALQTVAALKAFGLLDSERGKDAQLTVSEDARTYLRAQQDNVKREVLKRAALKPKQIEVHWQAWGQDRPPDPICLDVLVLKEGFSQDGAIKFLKVYDETIAFVGLSEPDKLSVDSRSEHVDVEQQNVPPPEIKVGDYIQWTSGGIDQFKPPRKVIGIFPDGAHVQVFGSNTGVPITETTVVDPPAPPPFPPVGSNPPRVDANSAWGQGENKFNVLQTGGRLQISADVDLEGLQELKEMLVDYEAILTRLSKRTKPKA